MEGQSLEAQVPLALLPAGSRSTDHDEVQSSTGADV
jgi:hypothetical protein